MSVMTQKGSDTEYMSDRLENRIKKTYSVYEIAKILQISRSKAYALCRNPEFKIIRLGRTIRISKESFDNWLNQSL